MEIIKDYKPVLFEPVLPEGVEHEILNEDNDFTPEEAQKYMSEHFVAMNEKGCITRMLDPLEIEHLRDTYKTVLEEKLPIVEKELTESTIAFEAAKSALQAKKEQFGVLIQNVKDVAKTVNEGTTEHNFGAHEFWKVPVGEQYRFYALFEGKLILVGLSEIPRWERDNVFNAMNSNKESYETLKGEGETTLEAVAN